MGSIEPPTLGKSPTDLTMLTFGGNTVLTAKDSSSAVTGPFIAFVVAEPKPSATRQFQAIFGKTNDPAGAWPTQTDWSLRTTATSQNAMGWQDHVATTIVTETGPVGVRVDGIEPVTRLDVYVLAYDGDDSFLRQSGRETGRAESPVGTLGDEHDFTIGGPTRNLVGNVAEIVVYDGVPELERIRAIEDYLDEKWNGVPCGSVCEDQCEESFSFCTAQASCEGFYFEGPLRNTLCTDQIDACQTGCFDAHIQCTLDCDSNPSPGMCFDDCDSDMRQCEMACVRDCDEICTECSACSTERNNCIKDCPDCP